MLKAFSFIFLLTLISSGFCSGQNIYRGIIIDSASFAELPSAHIQVKGTEKKTISSRQGRFSIAATAKDTLVFSMVGYHSVELPLLLEEDILLIRLGEQIRWLDEVTIKASRLYPDEIVSRTKPLPRRMSPLEGMAAPINYFWKLEREKRKLARIVEDDNKTQTYRQIITNPVVKDIMMKAYPITELFYYEQIARFNQEHATICYSADPDEIMDALHDFFKSGVIRK